MEISAVESDGYKTSTNAEEVDGYKTSTTAEETNGFKASTSIEETDGLQTSPSIVDSHEYKTLTSKQATIFMLLCSSNFFLFMCSIGYMGMGSSLLVLDQHLGVWEKYAGRKIMNTAYISIVVGFLLCINTSIGYGIFTSRNQRVLIKFYMSLMLILLLLLLLGIMAYILPSKEVEEEEPGLWDKVKSQIPLKGRNKWNQFKEGSPQQQSEHSNIKSKLKPQKYDDGKDFIRILKIIITIWVAVPLVVTLIFMISSIVLSILLLRSQSTKDSTNAQLYVLYDRNTLTEDKKLKL